MIDTKLLRQKILDLAIRGKLVPQDPNDEPASELLKRIKAEKESLIKAGKIKRDKHESYIFRGEDKRYYEQIDGKTNDITEEIPFDIPDSWTWGRLGSIGTWKAGATPSRRDRSYYEGGTIPWLKTGDLNDGNITDIPEFITKKAVAETSVQLNPVGSVLIAMYGATIGKLGILQIEATTNQACCACQTFSCVDNRYLFWFLLSQRENFTSLGTGGAQPNISKDIIVNCLFPLPPLNEQKRIVGQVESLLKHIDGINENAVSLENTISLAKQKILDLAIRGKLVPQDPNDEPATELLKKIKAEKETLIKAGKLKRDKHESFIFRGDDNCYYEQIDEKSVDITEDIPFDIPESWSWCRLGSFANIIMGQSPDGSSVNNSGSGIEFHQGKIYFGERFLQPSTQRTIAPTRVVPAKSVLICVRAPVGIVNITNREICIGRGLAAAIPFHGISESFLAYWISARKNSLIEGATGSTFLAVSVDQVKGLLIPIPPLSEQQRITEKIAEINLALEATLE